MSSEDIKPGYKRTEVGVIPEDWDVCNLAQVSRKITDGDHSTPTRTHQGYYLLSARNVLNGRIDVSDVDYVGVDEFWRMKQRCDPEGGDILISCSGTIGRVAVVPVEFECVLVRSAALVKISPDIADSHFIQFWLQGSHAQKQIAGSVNQGAQPNLFLNHIERLGCPHPTIREQRAIATALSDVDALLAKLDQLIAKKRDLKQATMQQLLTGQTRLPGFSGAWQVKRLGDVIKEISDGGTPPTANWQNFDGKISWVVIEDIKKSIFTTKSTLTEQGLKKCASKLWPRGTLILSTGATIGEVGILEIEAATKQGICGIITDANQVSAQYMLHWFAQNKSLLLSKAQGSSIKEVRTPTIVELTVRLPSLKEQDAICEVLSDLDADIYSIESRRDKTRTLKQGMMQELLTGRIRLV